MSDHRMKPRGERLLINGLFLLTLWVLASCSTPNELATPEPTGLPIPTVVPVQVTSSPTTRPRVPIDVTREAFDTRVAQYRENIRTQVALTPPLPTDTIGPPEPTPTWSMGLEGCTNAPDFYPQMYGCWRGVVNSEILSVAGGRQGWSGDSSQGLLMIFHGPIFDPIGGSGEVTEVYSTPVQLGGVRLILVEGTRFTLVPYNPRAPHPTGVSQPSPTPEIIFIFDLATRQWVSPSGSPTVSVSPPTLTIPLPTVTVPGATVTVPPIPSVTVGLP